MTIEYDKINGVEIYKCVRPDGRIESRVHSDPSRPGDWLASFLSDPVTLETYPTGQAFLLGLGGAVVAQNRWPEEKRYDLDFHGYIEKILTAKNMQEVMRIGTQWEVNWELYHRVRHGRK